VKGADEHHPRRQKRCTYLHSMERIIAMDADKASLAKQRVGEAVPAPKDSLGHVGGTGRASGLLAVIPASLGTKELVKKDGSAVSPLGHWAVLRRYQCRDLSKGRTASQNLVLSGGLYPQGALHQKQTSPLPRMARLLPVCCPIPVPLVRRNRCRVGASPALGDVSWSETQVRGLW
jgi:hypothetical protein